VLPVVSKRGRDADRAMRSRLVVESVWLPSAVLPDAGAVWTEEHGRLRLTLPSVAKTYRPACGSGRPASFATCAWTAGAI
jgi:hypothetical protein